jgi:hypothetical protein
VVFWTVTFSDIVIEKLDHEDGGNMASETSDFLRITRCHNSEEIMRYSHRHENFMSITAYSPSIALKDEYLA